MTTHPSFRYFCILTGLSVLASLAFADTITLRSQSTLSRPVTRLATTGIILDKNQMVNWTNVASLVYDRPPLQAPGQRLLLRSGIGLCGTVARTTGENIIFRSITAGEITVAWSNVTAIRYGQSNRFPENADIKAGEILLVLNDEERITGTFMGATEQQLLLRTADGMKKNAIDDIVWLVVHPTVFSSRNMTLILRNGDRLNGPVIWKNNEFSVMINDQPVNMDQAAIRAVINPGAVLKEKE